LRQILAASPSIDAGPSTIARNCEMTKPCEGPMMAETRGHAVSGVE
jgi:hypothetical protein